MFRIIQAIIRRRNDLYIKGYINCCSKLQHYRLQSLRKQFSSTFVRAVTATSRQYFTSPKFYCTSISEQKHTDEKQPRIYSSHILNSLNDLKPDEGLALLQCSGLAILNEGSESRSQLVDTIWEKLRTCGKLTIEHYHTYLQRCIENRRSVNFQNFLQDMNCEANQETYQLLLTCSCECGNIDQGLEIVKEMKNQKYVADERLFNSLVLGHALKGGLSNAKGVFETMRRAHVPVTSFTYLSLLRGLILHGDSNEFFQALEKFPIQLQTDKFIELLFTLALSDNQAWLNKILQSLGPMEFTKQELEQIKLMCIRLVHLGKPDAANFFYRKFIEYNAVLDGEHYTTFLLKEMLLSGTQIEKIINLAKDLKTLNENMLALEDVTEIALKNCDHQSVWKLFDALPRLRPHYFWPLLKTAGYKQGEMGIFTVIKKMLEYDVKPDAEMIEFYCLSFCDSTDYGSLLTRFQNCGLTAREVVTPMLSFLLRRKEVDAALQLVDSSDVVFSLEKLIVPLSKAWIGTKNNESIVLILKRISKTNSFLSDNVGNFIFRILRYCQTAENHLSCLNLLKTMHKNEIFISSSMAESLLHYVKQPSYKCNVTSQLEEAIDSLVNSSVNQTQGFIPHPRNMDINDLENHLTELQNKNMEIRGVLRRLIQSHSNLGNEERAYKLRQQFIDAGYEETPGMVSSLLFASVLNKNTDRAFHVYKELKNKYPKFLFDEFKIIDLATLLVASSQFDSAMSMLLQETKNRKVKGGKALMRNCWQLLTSANDEYQMDELFKFLVQNRYCETSNVVLGPLIKFHLNRDNVGLAAKKYIECTEKYRCTPLQLELLCSLIEAEEKELLQDVLDATAKIHGSESTTVSFIAALAQTGQHKLLQKFLISTKVIDKSAMMKRCERWVQENKLSALETLAQAAYRLPHPTVDVEYIYCSIMKLHSNNNDCDAAIKFYRWLLEEGTVPVPQNLIDELLKLVTRCKYKMPELLIKSQI